ncbi:hypothetical protein L202_02568 [Cryptococcus amylolentus CBS 6039]|uniref:Zn(2)-C6 fungal-type domain-containing protein n=2 Tax=Cryptococcus amylolentus TaxID=104669 RepID=A0A1E3I193_9TREE|nr:hypothetical protein L202_02568 [Cryptococcus amylolentus CBS 6039]ODN82288.1 hypothetical protein L202_02568 [Cryptococcus amylolentus CBS 6039]ODO09640.1 hypothetical protein I350_01852 [Cryptococcus amylolentus CBS 6273]
MDAFDPIAQQQQTEDSPEGSTSSLGTAIAQGESSSPVHQIAVPDNQEPAASSPSSGKASRKIHRGKTGCYSCRLRRKRCDEAKPICATCERLGIECMGYGTKRPGWLRDKESAQKAKEQIKQTTLKRSHVPERKTSGDSPEDSISTTITSAQNSSDVLELGGMGLDAAMVDASWNQSMEAMGSGMMGGWGMPSPAFGTRGILDGMGYEASGSMAGRGSGASTPQAGHVPSYLVPRNRHPAPTPFGPVPPSRGQSVFGQDQDDDETEGELNDLWSSLFGSTFPASWGNVPGATNALLSHPASPFYAMPSPSADLALTPPLPPSSQSNPKEINYLNHYLNVVLPLQYRIMGISVAMGDFVAPLAISRPEVLASVSSLAALHLVSKRTKNRNRLFASSSSSPSSSSPSIVTTASGAFRVGSASITELNDEEALVATASHQRSIERLRFLSPADLTSEEVVVSVLFAMSYHLFSGGTSKHLREMVEISQRCLSAAVASSPELGEHPRSTSLHGSPWSRYRHLIEHMIWADVIASVSYNKSSRLLSTYRRILLHMPAESFAPGSPMILMDQVMGCDSTTLLAYTEIVALSEWKDRVEKLGCLSMKELLRRAEGIEKLMDERAWRESHLDRPREKGKATAKADEMRRVMSDVFFGAAKVLLASVINGPFPRVPDIACAVQDVMEALNRLDITFTGKDIFRALVLPMTIAGCHCESESQKAFFRECFDKLGEEAKAFGNTGPARELMEEVWRTRMVVGEGDGKGVGMREVMGRMGWEAGVLLI